MNHDGATDPSLDLPPALVLLRAGVGEGAAHGPALQWGHRVTTARLRPHLLFITDRPPLLPQDKAPGLGGPLIMDSLTTDWLRITFCELSEQIVFLWLISCDFQRCFLFVATRSHKSIAVLLLQPVSTQNPFSLLRLVLSLNWIFTICRCAKAFILVQMMIYTCSDKTHCIGLCAAITNSIKCPPPPWTLTFPPTRIAGSRPLHCGLRYTKKLIGSDFISNLQSNRTWDTALKNAESLAWNRSPC